MEKLKEHLEQLLADLPDVDAFRDRLETLVSVYPFNEYEYIIAKLLAAGKLNHDEYIELRDAFIARNMFLYIFEISAPRTFGEAWAQGHLKELVPDLQKPSKKLDSSYSGEMESNPYYSSGQHRGNVGEGQLHLKDSNISEFQRFEVRSDMIAKAIRDAYRRQIAE